MNRKSRIYLGLLVGGIVAWLSALAVAAPWGKLLTLERVEADPNKTYALTEEHGPWMILTCTFSGDNARKQASDLVYELRKKYKLVAYMYEKEFELGQQTVGRGIDRYGDPLKMRYQRGAEVREIAVMVGNYSSVDDPEAQKTLQELKYTTPDCLTVKDGKQTNQTLAALRLVQKEIHSAIGSDKKKRGPMGHAFLTTNPLLPKDYFAPKGVDKLVLAMNEGNRYSLLECPGKYTVQVAHFTGRVIIDQKAINAIEKGEKSFKSGLIQAGEKAEKLCEALRMKQYEAYVFHDRYASIVTVGSFNSVGSPRADGRTEINPDVHAVMKAFGAEQVAGGMKPKELMEIQFDIQPIPVQVPKRSISSDYSRN
ncbi:MAG: hypothetical protein ABFD16_07385 [Thermoguttaceae bacterium]|jgi:hypothetical protein